MILDASAVLAFLLNEAGRDVVLDALMAGADMTAVNFAEVATKYVLRRAKAEAATLLEQLPVTMVAVDADLALRSAMMAGTTRPAGLSLGDRVCLALAQRSGKVALTADRTWLPLAEQIGAKVQLIR